MIFSIKLREVLRFQKSQEILFVNLEQGFSNFFTKAPFKEIKKVMAPFNKITHKLPFFFALHLRLKNI